MASQVIRATAGTNQGLSAVGMPPISVIAWQRSGFSPLTAEYRYIGAVPTAWASLSTTTKFNDVTPTDPDGRTTYESGTYAGFYNKLFGAMYFGGSVTITSFTAQVYSSMAGTAVLPSRQYAIYTSNDGVTWTISGSFVTISDGWTAINWTGSLTCAYLGLYVVGTNANQIPVVNRIGTFTIATSTLTAPTLSATFCSSAADTVSFTWTPQEISEGYRLYKDGSPYLTFFNPAQSSFALTGQTIGESHSWALRSEHGSLESSNSNTVTGAPSAPPTVTMTGSLSVCGKFVDLNWNLFPDNDTGMTATLTHNYTDNFGNSGTDTLYNGNADGTATYELYHLPLRVRAIEVGFPQTFTMAITNACGSVTLPLTFAPVYTSPDTCDTTYAAATPCSTTYTAAAPCSTTWRG